MSTRHSTLTASSTADILHAQFGAPIQNADLQLMRGLKQLHPSPDTRHASVVVRACSSKFPLAAFLGGQGVQIETLEDDKHELLSWDAHNDELVLQVLTGTLCFGYKETSFVVYKITWDEPYKGQRTLYDFVYEAPSIADTAGQDGEPGEARDPGHALIAGVFKLGSEIKDAIWVFQEGGWSKDRALWTSIQNSSWHNVVLEEGILESLRRDTRTFFENKKIYEELGVAWKRGLLLLGPPGNGKTESIKALLKESKQAGLYVKSFTTMTGPEHGVRTIFQHARENAPCILVIEDLDSLVTDKVRSFFLNELDGLGQNEGILTIATTNHPERIDGAILNRPSRFDVKYDFALPNGELRSKYAVKWIGRINALAPETSTISFRDDDALVAEISKRTEGWSFAFLKELFVSFLLRIAHDKARSSTTYNGQTAKPDYDEILLQQIEALSKQILKVKEASVGDKVKAALEKLKDHEDSDEED